VGDLVYEFEDSKRIVAHNVEVVDAPDHSRTAGDTNYIPSVSFQAVADEDGSRPAIEIINNS
jgi:hypothetical protein